MSAVMLYCVVESNPAPRYYWTKGNSREVLFANSFPIPPSENNNHNGSFEIATNRVLLFHR